MKSHETIRSLLNTHSTGRQTHHSFLPIDLCTHDRGLPSGLQGVLFRQTGVTEIGVGPEVLEQGGMNVSKSQAWCKTACMKCATLTVSTSKFIYEYI